MELQGGRLVSSSSKLGPAIHWPPSAYTSAPQDFQRIFYRCIRACPTIGEGSETEMNDGITPLYCTFGAIANVSVHIIYRNSDTI